MGYRKRSGPRPREHGLPERNQRPRIANRMFVGLLMSCLRFQNLAPIFVIVLRSKLEILPPYVCFVLLELLSEQQRCAACGFFEFGSATLDGNSLGRVRRERYGLTEENVTEENDLTKWAHLD